MKRLHQLSVRAALSYLVRMAMGYAQEGVERKRLSAACDAPNNIANPNGKNCK